MRPAPLLLTLLLLVAGTTTQTSLKKYGAGVYNDTLRAAPFYAQLPTACNLTGSGGWVLLFLETLDGGENLLPARAPSSDGCGGAAPRGKACACRADGGSVALSCPNRSGAIASVAFASVGTPSGTCGNLSAGTCSGDPAKAKAYVAQQCVGKRSCTLDADIKTFNSGKDPCFGVPKRAVVSVTCSAPQPPPPPPTPPEQAPSGMNPYPSNAQPAWEKGVHTASTYRAVAAREFDLTSPENACKMDATEPQQGRFSWAGCDLLANFTAAAKYNGDTFSIRCCLSR